MTTEKMQQAFRRIGSDYKQTLFLLGVQLAWNINA